MENGCLKADLVKGDSDGGCYSVYKCNVCDEVYVEMED